MIQITGFETVGVFLSLDKLLQLDINFENWFFAPARRRSNINVKGLKIYRLISDDVGRYLNDFMKTLSVSDFNRNFQN